MYSLVDGNSFFASCEQVFRPDLRGKAVVVLSNNDGCVVARSKEAKALGIPDLEPYFKIEHLLKKHGVHIFSSNYALYADLSSRVMQTLERFSPNMEIYSIDEAFLDLTGFTDLITYGQSIKKAVWKETRIPVGVGIAPTKTLAKLANHVAKRHPQGNGVCVLDQPHKWEWVLRRIETKKIWGIGSRISQKLSYMGIHTGWDLVNANQKILRKQFSVMLERTIEELNGTTCYELDELPAPKKEIFSTRSFNQKIHDIEGLLEAVSSYASRAAEKLRKQNSTTQTVHVFINSSRFIENPYYRSGTKRLLYPTNDTREIVTAVKSLVRELYKEDVAYAKAGVGLLEIRSTGNKQPDLFCEQQSPKSEALMLTMDKINRLYDSGVFLASNGIKQKWKMNRSMKSQSYTTRWNELPVVNS